MRKTLLLCCLIYSFTFMAQVTNEGTPASWNIVKKTSVSSISLPPIDLKKIEKEDAQNDKLIARPYRIGIPHNVNYGLDKGGFWTELPNGDRIWRILFTSDEAVHLSVVFDQFFLPKGGNIYMYNDDRTDLLGAYTEVENNEKEVLGSWFVKGDKLWIEYYEPREVRGQGKLHLSTIIHGYKFGHHYQKGYNVDLQKSLNDSGDCQHDVNCFIGSDFESQKNILKKSVAFLNMGDGYICSGGLVNNTAEDKTPYFLSANHCYTRDTGVADPSLFSMRFNWISPNPICAETASSNNGPENMVMTGSTFKARHVTTDFLLLKIDGAIPLDWDVTYAGWDRSDTNPTFEVGIHHPAGDIMKISRDNNGAIKGDVEYQSEVINAWLINGVKSGSSTPLELLASGWEIGVTEGGSSGSPLFNQDGRVIGQLFGGFGNACDGLTDNGNAVIYGRFATSWNLGLSEWLDPLGTGEETLGTLESVLAVNDEYLVQNISIFPNPTSGLLQIKITEWVTDLEYEVYNVLGQTLKSNKLQNNEILNLSDLPSDIYFMKITEIESNRSLVKKIVLNK